MLLLRQRKYVASAGRVRHRRRGQRRHLPDTSRWTRHFEREKRADDIFGPLARKRRLPTLEFRKIISVTGISQHCAFPSKSHLAHTTLPAATVHEQPLSSNKTVHTT